MSNHLLSPCPSSPNCVSTKSSKPSQRMAAIFFKCSVPDAQKAVKEVIEAMPRARITRDEPGFLHAEFTSKIFGFVDDVELVFNEEEGRIDFRSASRVGYYDFGANRSRMETIRQSLKQLPDVWAP